MLKCRLNVVVFFKDCEKTLTCILILNEKLLFFWRYETLMTEILKIHKIKGNCSQLANTFRCVDEKLEIWENMLVFFCFFQGRGWMSISSLCICARDVFSLAQC